tara:strand:- start:2303 stop:2980 length:678 start_codon:yes stop_codon:yes gene_type:complete
MSFTFAELKTAIQSYTDNSETTFVSNLSNFIKSAEQRIFAAVDLENFRKNATGVMTSGNQYLRTPTDFLAPFSIYITTSGSEGFLLEKDVNFIREAFPDVTTTGTPLYYGFFDSSVTAATGLINANLILGPTPNSNYAVEMHYYYKPDSLTAGADSEYTWLSQNAPNALLYGSLIEAYIFMKGEQDVVALYEGRFNESMSRLKDLAEARENSDAYREGLPIRERT